MNCKKNASSNPGEEKQLFHPESEKVVEIGLERLRPFKNHPFNSIPIIQPVSCPDLYFASSIRMVFMEASYFLNVHLLCILAANSATSALW